METLQRKASILLVDDHACICDGMKQLIELEDDLEVCGQAGSCREALEAAKTLQPDLVLLDLTLKDGCGMDLIPEIHACSPDSRILVMSLQDEKVVARAAIKAGAHGYIMKCDHPEVTVGAIRCVLNSHIYLSEYLKGAEEATMRGMTVAWGGVPA